MQEVSNIVTANDVIDILEQEMQSYPIPECPLKHTLTKDQYIREIFMPAGNMITSKIHNTQHPYFILQGVVSVFTEREGEVLLKAPYSGITEPNTRRVLYIHEDCIWVTVHTRLEGETIEQIGERILVPHDNKLLEQDMKDAYEKISKYGIDEVKQITSKNL